MNIGTQLKLYKCNEA